MSSAFHHADLPLEMKGVVQSAMWVITRRLCTGVYRPRSRSIAVIEELGLHPEERKRLKPEELLELVRRDLKVQPLERMLGRGDVNAFKIAFIADTPQLAQAVTQRLTTLFIEQNLKARADQ